MSQRAGGRRLSDIIEERRGSVPSDLMRMELEKMQKRKYMHSLCLVFNVIIII